MLFRSSDLIPVYQKLGFVFAESNPELEMNGKVQAQWEYFKTEQHTAEIEWKKDKCGKRIPDGDGKSHLSL